MTSDDYLNLITSAFRQKPKFSAMVAADVSVQVRVQQMFAAMIPIFDVDQAVGRMLDIIGEWVGVARNISIPIAGVYFAWDSTVNVGWDNGTWQPYNDPQDVTVLPDDAYRVLIKAKIAANRWDGTTDGAYAIWDSVFASTSILIQDHQNMTYDLIIFGGPIDSLTIALITGGYIPLRPEGVLVQTYYISVDSNPVFGWDVESEFLGGWDEASWTQEVDPS